MKKLILSVLTGLIFSGYAMAHGSGPAGINPWKTRGTTTYIDNRQVEIRNGAHFSIMASTESAACNSAEHTNRIAISSSSATGEWVYVCEGVAGWVKQGSGAITGAVSTRVEKDGAFIINTATINVGSPLTAAVSGLEALFGVDSSSVAIYNASGYINNNRIDSSSITKVGPTIEESEIVFNPNDGTRHDHLAGDITNTSVGTDITSDLEEETHASEHENGAVDEISVEGLSGLLADKQTIQISTGGTVVKISSGINFIAGSNIQITGADSSGEADITITALPSAGAGIFIRDGTSPVVQTSSVSFSTAQFIVTDVGGIAVVDLDQSSVPVFNASGYIYNSQIDSSSVTKVGPTIEESEVVFETNDGSRHDHVAIDISNTNVGTDLTADLEEETHASEHADSGGDEIVVTAGMMNTGTNASANTYWQGDNTWANVSSVSVNTVGVPQINASGTSDSSTFLRGDGTWTAPAGSGDVILASTQTHSGAKTYDSWSVFNGSVTISTFTASSGTITTLNIGTSITWPDGTVQVSSPSASAGGGTPGGSNQQIQYNDGGSFGGSGKLTYNADDGVIISSRTNNGEFLRFSLSNAVWTDSQQIEWYYGPSGFESLRAGFGIIPISNVDELRYTNSAGTAKMAVPTGKDTGEMRLYDNDGGNYAGFAAHQDLTTNVIMVLPTTATAVGQVLEVSEVYSSSITLVFATDDTGGGGGSTISVEDGGTEIVQTSTMDFTGAQFVVTNNGGDALIALDVSSVTLQGNTFNGASQLIKTNASGINTVQTSSVTGSVIGTVQITDNSINLNDPNHTITLAGDPALASGQCYWSSTGIICEGSTANTIETLFTIVDPTSSDKTITFPNLTGEVPVVSATGHVVRTAANTFAARTMTGSTNDISVSNGSGASGNPTFTFSRAATLAGNPALSANHATIGSTGIIFEGSTADTIETLLAVTDPTSTDKTITIPNITGTVVTTGDTGSVTSTMILNSTILAADMGDSDHGDVSWTSNVATVDNVAAANVAAGSLGASVIASSVAVNTVGPAQINASGTRSGSTYLDGSGAWSTPAGGSGGGYDVEPATVTFQLDEGFTATAGTITVSLSFKETVGIGNNIISILPPDAVTNDFFLKLPDADGSNGEVLSTDGSGVLSFIAAGAGDAILASTQTFTGGNTFVSSTTFISSVTIKGAVIDGSGSAGTSGQVYTSNGDGNDPTWQAATGGSAVTLMDRIHLMPATANLPSSNPGVVDLGSTQHRILYDDSTAETNNWTNIRIHNYQGGTVKSSTTFSMVYATSNTVIAQTYVYCITPGDSADIDTASYDSVNASTVTVSGTAGYPQQFVTTLTNKDSMTEGDTCVFKFERLASSATDDATGDLELRNILIYEE